MVCSFYLASHSAMNYEPSTILFKLRHPARQKFLYCRYFVAVFVAGGLVGQIAEQSLIFCFFVLIALVVCSDS